MLSRNFSFDEFTRTDTGLPNIPNASQIAAGKALAVNILEPVRAWARTKKPDAVVKINSWFRSPTVNIAVGGSSTSQHLHGEAVDFEIAGITNADIWNFIYYELKEFDQLIGEKLSRKDGSAGWIHVSYHVGRLRKDGRSFLGGARYVKGLQYAF